MKNIRVQAIKDFDDYDGQAIKKENTYVHRTKGDIFNCTKERYECLRRNNAVILVGVDKTIEEAIINKVYETATKRKTINDTKK